MKMLFPIILMMFSGLISSQNSATFKVSRLKISKFDNEKNKWMPFEEAKNVKVPNKISEIEEKLELYEEFDTDSD